MKVLLFAGAGTSVELGVPGMSDMAKEFLDHARQWHVEPDLVRQIMGESLDIELLIEALDQICTARASLEKIGQDTLSLERVDKIRAEVEWFVQHAAERVVSNDARLMWGSVLRAALEHRLTLVTTNYDRAIELAANAENVLIDDGFDGFGDGETSSWTGFNHIESRLPLIKLHGSTDWFAAGELAKPTKLRHPMALFGRAKLQLTDNRVLGSALVLPSREKLLQHDPYPRLSQTFLNASDGCDVAIFVGSSLRDHHIRDAASTTAGRVPVFVVNRSGNTHGIQGAKVIKQYASTFLVATLPKALLTSDPITALTLAAVKQQRDDKGILRDVCCALDEGASVDLRCQALEQLDKMETTLSPHFLRGFLQDKNSKIARYSFGLISLSTDRTTLVKEAATTPHTGDAAFCDDLELLQKMVEKDDKFNGKESEQQLLREPHSPGSIANPQAK